MNGYLENEPDGCAGWASLMIVIAIITAIMMVFTSCEKEFHPGELDGRWYKFNAVGKTTDYNTYIEFHPEGHGLYSDRGANILFYWSVKGPNIAIMYPNYSVGYHYEVVGDMLRLYTEINRITLYIHDETGGVIGSIYENPELVNE